MLKLYGATWSPPVQLVANILVEMNVPFELIEVDTAHMQHKSAEYREKQPFGQMPYIDDDGFILYESRAIARYIAEKYAGGGPALIPPATNFQERALFEQAVSVNMSDFNPYAVKIHFAVNMRKIQGLEPDMQTFLENRAQLTEKLGVYEQILARHKYLGGDTLTLADLFHLPFGNYLALAGCHVLTSNTHPNVVRWWQDISSRPAWRKVLAGVSNNWATVYEEPKLHGDTYEEINMFSTWKVDRGMVAVQ